ncbi:hypothetical protein EDC01DRAFT_633463 [Geopyxis carbonaria]|nr:hypothetical protein EDC01DRAFT_633463 [Geopyxis carbonaria]
MPPKATPLTLPITGPLTLTPLLKPGALSHPPPSPSPSIPSNLESPTCISIQTVSALLSANPITGGNFIIFRRKTRLSPSTPHQSWDVISGWGYNVTTRGTVVYTGRERALESCFVRSWGSENLQRLHDPGSDGAQGLSFALLGQGNHASYLGCRGTGSWRRLMGTEPGLDEKSTHCVFMELPQVVGAMVARGCRGEEVVEALRPGEFGTLRCDFRVGMWTEPEDEDVDVVEMDAGKEWKRGWWVTKRHGMGVWVS